jgi:putative DNA primase/helicase
VLSVATPAADDHPYLLRKGVKSHGLLQYKDSLVIPAQDVRGTIKTLQFIAPYPKQGEREKIFLKHGDKKGAFFVIGALSPMRPAVVVEGYATGASIHEVTGLSVVVAFDAWFLDRRGSRSDASPLVSCAQADWLHDQPVPETQRSAYDEGASFEML